MPDSQTAYRMALRALLQENVYPYVEDWEKTQTFPRHILHMLGQEGLFAPCFPTVTATDAQKLPLQVRMLRILIEELAKAYCFGLTLSVSMHIGVFLPLILRLAQPEVRDLLLEPTLRGEALGTIAATEANVAGSDFMGMECTAQFKPECIVLTGHKHYITNAAVADYVIVFARWRPGRHFANFCALLVPTRLAGIRSTPVPMAVMKTAVISRIEFHDVELPLCYLLGRKELGMRYFLQHIAIERLSGSIWAAVVADQCLAETQRYTTQRYVEQKTLWSRSSVSHRIAQSVVQVTLLRALVEQSLAQIDENGDIDPFAAAVMKAAVAPMMESIMGTCLQLQGARGLEAHSPLLRLLNEFRVFGVAGGSTETMLDIIAELWAQRCAQTD